MKTNLTYAQVKQVVSKDYLRPAMNFLYYDVPKSRLVGTDGHILACWGVEPDEGDQSRLISIEAFNRKGFDKPSSPIHILTRAGKPTVTVFNDDSKKETRCEIERKSRSIYSHSKASHNYDDERYPDYCTILDTAINNCESDNSIRYIGLNVEYMDKINKAMTKSEETGTKNCRIFFDTPTRACIIRPEDASIDEVYIIMPILLDTAY